MHAARTSAELRARVARSPSRSGGRRAAPKLHERMSAGERENARAWIPNRNAEQRLLFQGQAPSPERRGAILTRGTYEMA